QTRYHLRSRFFDELPEEALKWLTPKQSGFGQFAGGGRSGGAGAGYSSGYSGGYGGQGQSAGWGASAAPSAPVPRKAEPAHGLRVGMQVFHNKFGEGTVLALEGTGGDARAQVKFSRHGVKWLALSVAKLTPV
ncbi:MAG: DNA helicase II, partial [Comamonadaceae bacterium]